MAEQKTNVMRLIDAAKLPYKAHCYLGSGAVSGMEIVQALGENPDRTFKTLVTVGRSGQHYVFVVPVNRELDLKKAAAVAKEKSIEMIKSKDLLKTTGYIHGGCSPIGMKKLFPTAVHESALSFDTILFSAGKIGFQVEMSVQDLQKMIPLTLADLVVS